MTDSPSSISELELALPITWSSKKLPLSELQDYDKNPRRIKKKDFEKLCAFLKDDGYVNRIIVDANNIIVGGHQRKRAMLAIGYKPTDIIEVLAPSRALTSHEFDRINIRNNIGIGEYDFDILANNFSIEELTAFGLEDLDSLMPTTVEEGLTDADSVPEMPTEPRSKLGDVWLCGEHRVVCGDSVSVTDIERLLGGDKASMVFTSPPYNGNTHLDYGKKKGDHSLYNEFNDNKGSEEYIDFLKNVLTNLFIYTEGFIFWNINYNANSRNEFLKSLIPFFNNLWETICWKKTGMPLSHGLTRNFEFIFCFKTHKNKNNLGRENETNSNLWEVSNAGCQTETHKACFPVELVERAIKLSTKDGDIVLDPFGGSGTTLIACEKNNRKCLMIELSPVYVDVIILRYMKFTGKKATLEETGEAFD